MSTEFMALLSEHLDQARHQRDAALSTLESVRSALTDAEGHVGWLIDALEQVPASQMGIREQRHLDEATRWLDNRGSGDV